MAFYLALLLDTILVSNVVLAQFLGICPFLGVSKKLDSAVGMGLSVTCVLVISTAVTWLINHAFLEPYSLGYLRTLVFILVIASLVQLLEISMKKFIPSLHRALGIYLPLITTNCAVLGVTISAVDEGLLFLPSLVFALGSGLGFLLAMLLFAGVRGKMERCNIPQAFQGMPITLIAASIVAMAFMGFSGLADGIFGI
ncbi:MAG: RnfABCDGE type electron transport complex subunit A [Bacillota bacterium]|nr:RnfABCDGE type electron transport complex subunit A [Bacillota bacterium]